MKELVTGLKAIRLMWPMFVLIAVLSTLAEHFVSGTSLLGAKIVIYSFVVLSVHQCILTGEIHFWGGSKSEKQKNLFSFKFFGLLLIVFWFPAVLGAVAGYFLMHNMLAFGQFALFAAVGVSMWLSLTFFGTAIPKYVWLRLADDGDNNLSKNRSVWVYTGSRLIFWNLMYFALAMILLLVMDAIASSTLFQQFQHFSIFADIMLDSFSYIALALTAAVLSHAHLMAYDLQPQGLISRV